MTTVFPGPGVRNRYWRRKGVTDLVAARAVAGRSPENAVGHKAVAGGRRRLQWPVYHRNIRLAE